MKRQKSNLFVITCIITVTLFSAVFITLLQIGREATSIAHADSQFLECPSQVGDIRIDWRTEGAGLIVTKPNEIRQAVCTYVVKYDSFDNPEHFVSLLIQWCEELPCSSLNVPSGHWSNTVWSKDKWAFVTESIEYSTHPKIIAASQDFQELKMDLLAQAEALAVKRVDCDDYCKDPAKSGNNADHAIWDGFSDYPECACTCEKGWTMEPQGCVSCEDSCQEEGSHLVYDPDLSYTNVCECRCEDGYESGWDSSGNKACTKVSCPENAKNAADICGSSMQSDQRKISRHCYCDEGYVASFGTCNEKEPGTAEYFIDPGAIDIDIGGKTQFTLNRKEFGTYTKISNDQIEWAVSRHRSLNPNVLRIEIGTIDSNGEFTSKNIGTCQVTATSNGATFEAYVNVTCPTDEDGDLNRILELYTSRIPEGVIHDDLKYGRVSSIWGKFKPGTANNHLSRLYDKYKEFRCGDYQNRVLTFLHDIENDPDECGLLNNYEFGPIEGDCGGHHAVVIYPAGTDWKTEGIVLDPWPTQKPVYVEIDKWGYMFASGETQTTSQLYPTQHQIDAQIMGTSIPHCSRADDAALAVMDGILAGWDYVAGIVPCPVDLLITDNEGKRLGMLANGSMVYEIPYTFIENIPEGKNDNSWYFEIYFDTPGQYHFELRGIDEGPFEFIWINSANDEILSYGEQSIKKRDVATISIDPENPTIPLILPDGSEILPIITDISSLPDSLKTGLTFESRSKPNGTTVQIPLTLDGITETIGSLDITLSYDTSVLQAYEVTKGSLTSNSLFVSNIMDGTVMIGVADNDGFSGNGSVAYIRYNVIGTKGASSPLDIVEVLASRVIDFSDVYVPANDGVFTVTGMDESTGDCDGDGKLAVVDALCALQMSVGNIAEDIIMDINGDGRVTALDAMRILTLALQ